jgi:hypothetical protein
MSAQVCFGAVMHERKRPVANRFTYPLFYLRLPLSEVERVASQGSRLLGINRAALMRLDFRDHGSGDGGALLPWIRALLRRHGIDAQGEVVLQTMPRLFGYVFNPVSFWFCHDRAGGLRAVLCQVNNTFGERHNYLVSHADGRPILGGEWLRARKVFHVSPFFPVSGEYRFRFQQRGSVGTVDIDYWDGPNKMLATKVSGRSRALDRASLLQALLRFPFLTFGVIARIHWQALRLWWRRVGFFRKPLPPLEETTR